MLTVVLSPLTTKRGWYSALTSFAISSINARSSDCTSSKYSQWILVSSRTPFDFPEILSHLVWPGDSELLMTGIPFTTCSHLEKGCYHVKDVTNCTQHLFSE